MISHFWSLSWVARPFLIASQTMKACLGIAIECHTNLSQKTLGWTVLNAFQAEETENTPPIPGTQLTESGRSGLGSKEGGKLFASSSSFQDLAAGVGSGPPVIFHNCVDFGIDRNSCIITDSTTILLNNGTERMPVVEPKESTLPITHFGPDERSPYLSWSLKLSNFLQEQSLGTGMPHTLLPFKR